MRPVPTVAEMRAVDQDALVWTTHGALVGLAGRRLAAHAKRMLGANPSGAGQLLGPTSDPEQRPTRGRPLHPHVVEAEGAETDPERLHGGLLGREPGRQPVRRPGTGGTFQGREHPLLEPGPPAQDQGEAGHVDGVDANPDHGPTLRRAAGATRR